MGLGVTLDQQELVRNEADGLQEDRAVCLSCQPQHTACACWSWGR